MPTFGYTTVGANYGNKENFVYGGRFQMGGQNGVAQSITMHINETGDGRNAKCQLYRDDYSLLGETQETAVPAGEHDTTFPFVGSKPPLIANAWYIITGFSPAETGNFNCYWDTGGETNQEKTQSGLTYPNTPDPLNPTTQAANKPSIYCTYTVTAQKKGSITPFMMAFLLGSPFSSPYESPPPPEPPQIKFESGFEPPVYVKTSKTLGGGGWDNVLHRIDVYGGLDGGWSLDTSVKYSGAKSLKEWINGIGTAERAQVNFLVARDNVIFGSQIYASVMLRMNKPTDAWQGIELLRERGWNGEVVGGHELSIELRCGAQFDVRCRDLAVKDAEGNPIVLWEYLNIFPAPDPNTWHKCEYSVKRHATEGQVKFALDDVTKLNVSNVRTYYTQDFYRANFRVYVSPTANFPFVHYWDDIKFSDTDLIG